MNTGCERRTEERLRYQWPIWYAEDFQNELSQGQMVDVSSRAAAFTCYADDHCPYPGQHLTARFSVPRFGRDESFDLVDIIRVGRVCRVDGVNSTMRRVAIQFTQPLPFSPGEQMADAMNRQE
jgi:hypothetical protein